MRTSKLCPLCSGTTVRVKRSRPVKVGRIRRMVCEKCNHSWGSIEMPFEFLRDHVLSEHAKLTKAGWKTGDEAIAALIRIVG